MAYVSVFDRRPTRRGRIGDLVMDATISEGHSRSNRVTRWPVENGSTISDHIANEPKRLSVEGFITDSPLESGVQFEQRVQTAYQRLNEMWKGRALVEVVTQYEVYRQMAIEKLDIPKSRQTGESLRFNISFVEIRKVSSQTVAIPADTLPPRSSASNGPTEGTIQDQATSESETGRQTATPPSAPVVNSTVLRDIVGSLGFGFIPLDGNSGLRIQQIPVNSQLPSQKMEVAIGSVVYGLKTQWNTRESSWSLGFLSRDDVPIIDGLKMSLNYELIDRFADERLPDGLLVAFDSTGRKTKIDRFDLGDSVQLLFIPRGMVQEIVST